MRDREINMREGRWATFIDRLNLENQSKLSKLTQSAVKLLQRFRPIVRSRTKARHNRATNRATTA